MANVEMIDNSQGRGKVFWWGFFIGLIFSLIVVVVFWLLGFINFGSEPAEEPAEEVNETESFDGAFIDDGDFDPADGEDADEDADPVDEEEDEDEPSSELDEFYDSAVMAKDVDESANPIGQTSTFSSSDDRFYVVATLNPGLPADTEIAVEWFRDDTLLSEFSTESEAGQSRVYFFQTNPGTAGDYAAVLSIDGIIVDEITFSVN